MAIQWVRLWLDMPTDGKFRTISRRSKQPLTAVLSVYILLLTKAGERIRTQTNANERGRTQPNAEIFASTLDLEIEGVESIFKAMQGLVLEGEKLTGWEARQPLREDESAERSKAWREARKTANANERKRTQTNANERQDKDTDIKSKEPPPLSPSAARRGARLAPNWEPSPALRAEIQAECPGLDADRETRKFHDHWASVPGWRGCKLDWSATWRNWCRKSFGEGKSGKSAKVNESLTERCARLSREADEREAVAEAKSVNAAANVETPSNDLW